MYLPLVFLVAVVLLIVGLLVPRFRDGVTYFAYCLIASYLTSLLLGGLR